MSDARPKHIDLKKDTALTVEWEDGSTSVYPIALLRKHSPSADQRELRKELAKNPLTVLPNSGHKGPVVVKDAELVGNYAIRMEFSDGHKTGIYTWKYLRELDGESDQ